MLSMNGNVKIQTLIPPPSTNIYTDLFKIASIRAAQLMEILSESQYGHLKFSIKYKTC